LEPDDLQRPRLLYFADTMCSWCYGFEPEMQRVLAELGESVELLLFAGGLRPFTREPMTPDLRLKLTSAYARIGAITGRVFAPAWQTRDAFIYDTEPASRAVVTMRNLAPGQEYAFMAAVQQAFYAGGEDITTTAVLARHAEVFGVSQAAFIEAFESETMRQTTLADFQVAQKFGIDGFPTIVLHRRGSAGEAELVLIAQGYAKSAEVIDRIKAALAGAPVS
jgi:putative protein-disulfide isomerase